MGPGGMQRGGRQRGPLEVQFSPLLVQAHLDQLTQDVSKQGLKVELHLSEQPSKGPEDEAGLSVVSSDRTRGSGSLSGAIQAYLATAILV